MTEQTATQAPARSDRSEFYNSLDNYEAIAIAEGFSTLENPTKQQQLDAWQYIRDHKLHHGLQGGFGRVVAQLLAQGLIE
jgi:hypothetical protein